MPGTPPEIIRIYRMVHVNNVEHVLRKGFCSFDHVDADPNYVSIGDSGLIIERKDFKVPISPGGMLGDYVPFYFGGHMPMLLNIKTGHRGIRQLPQHEIVFSCIA